MPSFDMPVLSFLPKTYKSKWKGKSAVKSPFSSRGIQSNSASSLHPYASPDVLDINDSHFREHSEAEETEESRTSSVTPVISSESPQVKLEIDITPEPLTDWFSNFPQSEPFSVPFPGDPGSSTSARTHMQTLGPYQSSAASRSGSVGDDTNEGGDDDTGTSSEDIIRGLQALGASDFISDSILDKSLQYQDYWRSPPTPIKIPNGLLNGPPFQTRRSADFISRPQSQVSSPPSSAVSGTTFARALLANTFVLSSDTRSSRYRSGFSGLVRSDSATLPRGEHPMLSPIWRERKNSSGADSLSPGSGDIPPIPAGAELLYVPPKTPRHSDFNAREKRKRRSSTGSLLSRPTSTANLIPSTPIRSSSNSLAGSPIDADIGPLQRRISRISEVTSAPQTPEITQEGAKVTAEYARNSPTPSPQPLSSVSHEVLPKTDKDTDSPILPPDSQFTLQDSPNPLAELSITSEEAVPVLSSQDGTEPPPVVVPPSLPTISPDLPVLVSSSLSETKDSYIPELPTSPDSNSSYPTSPEPNDVPSEQSPASERAPSSGDLGDVLDYYSFTNPSATPVDRGFKPVFSPISEESSSQLSPPTPYNRRESLRSPLGARSRSPLSSSGWPVVRKNSDPRSQTKHGLLPIGERPTSIQPLRNSVLATSSRNTPTPLSASGMSDQLIPPQTSKIFNRQRSGSAPSPIKVVRDSKDFNAYNITLSPLTDGSSAATSPSTGNIDDADAQTFPETPSGFSPMLSPNSVPSTVSRGPSLQYVIAPPMPSTPMSAALPNANIQPSLAQQILLTRAATSVHGARTHSRQMSLTNGRIQQSSSSNTIPEAQPVESTTSAPESVSIAELSADEVPPSTSTDDVAPAYMNSSIPLTHSQSNSSLTADGTSLHSTLEPSNSRSISRPISVVHASDSSSIASNISQTSSQIKPLPPVYSPSNPEVTRGPRSRPPVLHLGGSSNTSGHSHVINTIPQSPAPYGEMTAPPSAQVAVFPPQAPVLEETAESSSHSSHSHLRPTASATSEDFGALGSPPPYYTVVNVVHSDLSLPSNHMHSNPSPPPNPIDGGNSNRTVAPPITPTTSRSDQASLGREGPAGNRRPRTRPPQARPAGPRQPSHTSPGLGGRERNASISSVVSNSVTRVPSRHQPAAFSPKFQPPSAKWRGYTMEAAKWTFTSAQLQNIVSRAIRQSAEASSIRLLRLEILDIELPRELEKLEVQRTEVKTRYKMLTRRRNRLLEALSTQLGGTSEATDPRSSPLGIVEDLKDITTTLDMLAEDLHSVSEQIAQLEKLKQVHSASALSMALRKLNASFLKQFAENEVLRKQVDTLEAERDEAWKQAEEVASDFDRYLNDRPESSLSEQAKRSSRISASRKSSIRVSKAGLRSSSRRLSQRSSVSSSAQRFSGVTWPSSAKTSLYSDEVPPVPPIPRRRPLDIRTDLPSRSPAGLSTDMITPTSETRALAQVQEELYRMLGMSVCDTKLRRSRSVLGLSSPPISAAMSTSPFGISPSQDLPSVTRRLSMPGSTTIAEAHSAMVADRDAMLATLRMLSEDDD